MKKTNMTKLTSAIEEAGRFIERAKAAREEITEQQKQIQRSGPGYHRTDEPTPSRKFASVKRASLDLSAALVELRK